jgi:hypothetical protein
MIMSPRTRRIALTAHIAVSVGSLGAVTCFLVLALAGLNSSAPQTVRAVYMSMDLIARLVIVPVVAASLATGLVQSLGTQWGLFRHYWVIVKLAVSVLVLVVLLAQLEMVGFVASKSAGAPLLEGELGQARFSLAVHAAGGLLALLVPVMLSVFKPKGMTPYGWRRQPRTGSCLD